MKATASFASFVFALSSLAVATPARAAPTGECATVSAELDDRAGSISAMEHLPDACLKRLFIECQRAANERVLDLGTAAQCSMGYEALLRKGFRGDFQAMLAWWRTEGPS